MKPNLPPPLPVALGFAWFLLIACLAAVVLIGVFA